MKFALRKIKRLLIDAAIFLYCASKIFTDFFRRKSSIRIFYSPFVSFKANPYLHLLYSNFPKEFVSSPCFIELVVLYKKIHPKRHVVFHLHWLPSQFNKLGKLMNRIDKLKQIGVITIWTIHNIYEHDADQISTEKKIREKLGSIVDIVHVHNGIDPSIISSNYYIPSDKYIVAPHGNYIDVYPNNVLKEDCRKELDIQTDQVVFLFFGMIRPYKHMEILLQAFSALSKKYPQVLLLIVGKKAPNVNLQTIPKLKHVKLIEGFVKSDAIQKYMSVTDFCVLSYKNILTSGTAILALSFRKPVIVPNIGSLPYIISEAIDGWVYKASDAVSLSNALEKAINTSFEARQKMSQAAYDKAFSFSWSETGKILSNSILQKLKQP